MVNQAAEEPADRKKAIVPEKQMDRKRSKMKLVFASDSFKGSLSSLRTAEILEESAREVFGEVETVSIPLADGGEGTVDAVLAASDAKAVTVTVHGPLSFACGKPSDGNDPAADTVEAVYALFDDGRAVIEMASASGLTLVPEDRRDPLETTSFGTGELLLDAISNGAGDITIAIGGSATNDGGMGFMRAVGAAFYDADGSELEGRGRDLAKVARIDLSGLDKRLSETRISVMCDVDNPLTGASGATYTYGPQKGADEDALAELENGMCNYRDVIKDLTGIDCDEVPGAGAAGGIGAALYAFLGAELKPGIEIMLDLTGFDRTAEDADMVITGEGRADFQSLHGKAMQGVGLRAKEHGVPVTAIVGCLGEGWEGLFGCGIERIIPLAHGNISKEETTEKAEEYYRKAALNFFRSLKDSREDTHKQIFYWT